MSFSAQYWGWDDPFSSLALATWGWLEGVTVTLEPYCDEAKARLVEQYKQSEDLQGLICAIISEYQELETVFQNLKSNRSLDNAVGEQLDQLGDILGLDRAGLSDEEYRDALQAKVYFNVSGGQPEALISYIKSATDAENVLYQELYPANVNIFTDGESVPDNLYENAKSVVPAGVGLTVVSSYGEESVFGFDPEGAPDPDVGGYGEINDPDEGGTYAEKIS